jgi:hypothetical protein
MAIGVYKAVRENITAPTVGDDIMTLVAAANQSADVVEASIGGLGTTSVAMSARLQLSTGGVTGGGALTPTGSKQGFAAAGIVANTTWGTQPSASGGVLLPMPFNLNGGGFYWHSGPRDEEMTFFNRNFSYEHGLGAGNISALLTWREMF